MSVLYIALPVAILISAVFVAAYVWQMHSGQLDDLETPPRRILYDDVATVRSGQTEAVSTNRSNGTNVSDKQSE